MMVCHELILKSNIVCVIAIFEKRIENNMISDFFKKNILCKIIKKRPYPKSLLLNHFSLAYNCISTT